jgi:alpha-galactosidase
LELVAIFLLCVSLRIMHPKYDGRSFTLASELLELRAGPPSVELLSASGQWRFRWTVSGKGEVLYASRPSPHTPGLCQEQTHRWTHPAGFELSWTISSLPEIGAVTLRSTFRNGSGEPVRLAQIRLIDADTSQVRLKSSSSSGRRGSASGASGVDGWFATHLMNQETPTTSDLSKVFAQGRGVLTHDAMFLYRPGSERCFVAGAVGPGESDVRFELSQRDKGLSIGIASDLTEVLVAPGESRRSEEVLLVEGSLLETSELLLRWISQTHGVRTHRGTITGWCSWYDLLSKITAEHVVNVAKAIAADRPRLGVDVIQIDEGYQRRWGDWRPHTEKFPAGWAPVVDAIRSAGATPGLWIAPLGVHDDLGLLKKHPDWFQHQLTDGKSPTTNWNGNLSYLDPTHPDVQAFIVDIINNAKSEGFEYFKIDFNFISPCRFHDPTKTRFQAMRDLYRLYRRTMGEAVYLNACVFGLSRAVVGLADAARIAGDSMAIWDWLQRARPRSIFNLPVKQRLFANDPDVSYALPAENTKASGRSMNLQELRTWHSTVGLTGGVTMMSEPWHQPDFQGDEPRRMWEILRPVAPEHAVSWGATPANIEHPRLGFIAERAWGRFACVQLFNHQDSPSDVALRSPELAPLGKKFHAWSFWDRKSLGVITPAFVARKLPAHGSMLLRLTPVESDGRPTLVGSDLHVAMGSAEIADWAFDGQRLLVTLVPAAGARKGSLWIHSEKKLSLATDSVADRNTSACDVKLHPPARGLPGVWRLDVVRTYSELQRIAINVAPVAKRRALSLPGLPPVVVSWICNEEATWPVGTNIRSKTRATLRMESIGNKAWKGPVTVSAEPASASTSLPETIDVRVGPGQVFEREFELDIAAGTRQLNLVAALSPPAPKSLGMALIEPAGSAKLSTLVLRPRPIVTISADQQASIILKPEGLAQTNVKLRSSSAGLLVEARVFDMKITPAEPIWAGSCLEIFASQDAEPTAIAQVFLAPGDKTNPARAMFAKGLEQYAADDIHIESSPASRGYILRATIPWSRLGLQAANQGSSMRWLLEMQLTTHNPQGQTRTTAGGSTQAYASSDRYLRAVNAVLR